MQQRSDRSLAITRSYQRRRALMIGGAVQMFMPLRRGAENAGEGQRRHERKRSGFGQKRDS